MNFAIFANRRRARSAESNMDAAVDGDVELLTQPSQLLPAAIPIHMTMARGGAIVGASVVAGLTLVALAVMTWLAPGPSHMLAPYATIAIVVVLASVLGAIAGSISFATQARSKVTRLRDLMGYGHTVLLVESDRDVGELMKSMGAVQTGTLA